MNGLTIPQLAARETTEGDANNNPPIGTRITDDSLEPRAANDSPEPACFSLAALLVELRPHTELDQRTLVYHLQQSDATAVDGYQHVAINVARSFLESLTVTIGREMHRTTDSRTETACEPQSSNATACRATVRLPPGSVATHENSS